MKLEVDLLNEGSIQNLIGRISNIRENLEENVERLVEILTNEGAEVARAAYGNWPVETTPLPDGTEGVINVAGDMPLIAEFGAGQATMPVMFDNPPSTPVYEGSYSELVGSQEYYRFGSWHFAGDYYTEVPARHGLLDAKQYILEEGVRIAQEVLRYD